MGYTLIECLITLFCIAVLATLAMASNTAWLNHHQSSLTIDKLVHDLKFAREQAILRHSIVSVCPSIDQNTCSSATAWPLGYLVFVDPTGKAIFNGSHEKLIGATLMGSGTLSNSRQYVQFDANGFTRGSNSTFNYALNETIQKIIINLQGRIRVE
jgi:type IV fimbrial biogenesis protein FimT